MLGSVTGFGYASLVMACHTVLPSYNILSFYSLLLLLLLPRVLLLLLLLLSLRLLLLLLLLPDQLVSRLKL